MASKWNGKDSDVRPDLIIAMFSLSQKYIMTFLFSLYIFPLSSVDRQTEDWVWEQSANEVVGVGCWCLGNYSWVSPGGWWRWAQGGAPLLLLELQQRDSEESCSDVAPGSQSLDNGDQTQHREQTIQHPLNTFY